MEKRAKILFFLKKISNYTQNRRIFLFVAKNSGFFLTEDIDKLFSHVFEKEHLFDDGTIHKFFPDYDIVQSWIWLREGKRIQELDIILLNHELMKAYIMGKGTGIPYETAHEEAQKQYNYAKALKNI